MQQLGERSQENKETGEPILVKKGKGNETLNLARTRICRSVSFPFQLKLRLIFYLPMLFERRFNFQHI